MCSNSALAFSFGPDDELTGAPGEDNCTKCHAGNALNAIGGSFMLTVPQVYTPGEMYDIVVNLTRSGQSRWGFEMTALNENNVRAGTFAIADGNTQVSEANSRQYIKQTTAGSAQGKRNSNQWTFKWTAPTNDVGPITFYAAGNAANNADFTAGDYIYTNTSTSEIATYGVNLAGVGTLSKTVSTGAGASYTLRVTNTGNDTDTVRLTTSGDATATLNQSSVTLDAGASRNVTMTVSGGSLTSASEYKVNVTATSQKDSSKTDTVTTTTTVPPVYGVTLAGVGNLTTQTTDASDGVRYTLRVTNTGNTSERFNLTTSGDTTATLSRTLIILNAGASSTVSVSIPGASLVKAGTYRVNVTATSQNDSSKTAGITTRTTILPVYDITLAGVGALTTETADASEGVSYKFNITNNGNTDDVIDLTTSGTTATLSETSVSLASGASAEVTLSISGNVLATAGTYEVKVTATSQGDNTQTAEVTTTTTILPVYNITLAGVGALATETTDASEGVSYKFNITNNGNTDDVIDLSTSGTTVTLSETSVSLASGASAEVTLTISGDVLATAGTYEVKVTATSQGDNTQTAEVSTTTTILPVYGVSLAGVGALTSETADASEGVSYKFNITNNGNTDDVIDLITSDTTATLSETSVSLASGASAEVTLTISGDVLAMAGTYEVKVTATSQGDNTQTAEVSTTTTILPVYGVSLAGVGALTSETSDASEGVSYKFNITNNGNTDDVIDLITSGTTATLSETSVSLASGASTEVTLTISGDDLSTAGTYEVKVTATSQGDNTQTAEVSTTTTIPPVYGVSLAGVGALTSEISDASEGVSYKFNITNNGNTDDVIDLTTSGTTATLSETSVSLASGASAEVTLSISGNDLSTAGTYEVKVTATSQGDNTQTAEVTTTTTVLPVYGVMLASEDALTGATMDTVVGVTYTLTVTNTGNTDDTIILGSSAEAGIGGVVLGSFSLPDSEQPATSQIEIMLAAGESANVMFTAAGDLLTQPGVYEIVVTATSQGDPTKTAELTTTTTITVVPPEYGVTLEGVGELTGTTWDFLTGVTYTLTVTNTGDTDDTIILGSSAEVGIGGAVLGSFSLADSEGPATSQLEITLAAGESAEVMFTASGDFFTKLGEYEITVTATSQGDSTKSAEITTTTTIESVPWDLNADGIVNILDLVAVANQFGESGDDLSGDVNMDGIVNILDLVAVANYFGETQAEIVQANQ